MSLNAGPSEQVFHAGRVLGIPVSFTPWYFLFAVFVLSTAGFDVHGLLWLAVLTFSILVHELGHGLMAVRYGLGADIVIHAFGGWCSHAPARSRREDFHVVAAGPGAGFALALVSWFLLELTGTVAPTMVREVLWMMAAANVFLSFFNLLPIYSLDGGRMFHVFMGWHTSDYRADGMTWWTGTIVGALVALYGAFTGSLFILLLCGFMAYQNYQRAVRHPLKKTFFPKSYPKRASPGSAGLNMSWNLIGLAGGLFALWALDTMTGMATAFGAPLLLQVDRLAVGQWPWMALTYGWLHTSAAWAPMLLSILALALCGPTVEYKLGTRTTMGVYGLAMFVGALTATFLPRFVPGLASSPLVMGAGAPSMALLVAWAVMAPNERIGWGPWQATPRQITVAILFVDIVSVVGGLTTWNLPLHIGGILVGLAATLGGRSKAVTADPLSDPPPIDLDQFRSQGQGGQRGGDVWH